MCNYTERRRRETAVRNLHWLDNAPLEKVVRTVPYEAEKRFPVRLDEKTVVFVREKNLHKYFPLLNSDVSMADYMAEYEANPKNFLY